MKKLVLLTMMLVGNMMLTFAQNDTILYIEDYPESVQICLDKYDRVLIYAEEGCENYVWIFGEDKSILVIQLFMKTLV